MLHDYYSLYVVYAMFYENKFIVIVIVIVNTRQESIFSDPDVVRELSRLYKNFVIVPADKASNNYTFV